MRLSSFNQYVEGFPEPHSTLIHNTLSGAYLVLDDETVDVLRRADAGGELTPDERAACADPDLWDPDVAVLVESHEAEEAEFLAWFERKRRNRTLDILLSINLACNFDCPYCSQAGILDGTVMKPAVADRTADWIARRALEVGVEGVQIAFCGGEPLLHPERIERITRRVREQVAPAGLTVSFRLITNGYFLTPEMVNRLVPEGLTHASVTIDGDGSTHQLTRVSKKGEDTFQRIFDHVIAASRKIRVNVNGNYTQQTVHGFLPLIDQLSDADLGDGASMSFTPALEALTSVDWAGGGLCTWSEADTSLHVAMHDRIMQRGYRTPPLNSVGPCEYHDHHSFAIEPNGTIYKCPGFMGKPDWSVGHVDTGLKDDVYQRMIASTPQASCSGCSHRPNCGGGCLAIEWLKTGEAAGVNCNKDYFERVKDEALVRRFLLETADSVKEAVAAFPSSRHDEAASTRIRRPAALRVVAA